MKILKLLMVTVFLIPSYFSDCNNINKDTDNQIGQKQETKNISTNDLISLLKDIQNQKFIDEKLRNLDFKKKFNVVYISNEQIKINEPARWVHIYDIGSLSNVSFSTAKKTEWEILLKEIKNYGKPISFNEGTSSKATRYTGTEYTFETYEPKNGVNLEMNELYEIIIFKTKTTK